MKVTLIHTHSLTSLLHEGEEVVEEVLPLGAVGQFVELQERGEEKAFSSRRRQSVRPPSVRREIIKIMSGALSTKGGREGGDADYQVDLDGTPGIFHTRTRGKRRKEGLLEFGGGAFLRCIDIHWGRRRGNPLLR